MTTAADYEPELVDALNLLIEDERASVEMEVALASGATEYAERETLARMGADDIHSCETLRAEMERAGLLVTPQINGVVFEVLGAERYDDRLRAFAHHQRIVADRANDLLESNLDGELRDALVSIMAAHQRHIEWATYRADEFAATRLMEFGPRHATLLSDSAAPAFSPITADPPAAIPSADTPLPDIPLEDSPAEAPAAPAEEILPAVPAAEIPDASEEILPAVPAAEIPDASIEAAPAEAATPDAANEQPAPRTRRGRPRKAVPPTE